MLIVKEKTKRNQSLIDYHLEHPEMSISAVGRVFHLKPEVAWRIIKKMKKEDKPISKESS